MTKKHNPMPIEEELQGQAHPLDEAIGDGLTDIADILKPITASDSAAIQKAMDEIAAQPARLITNGLRDEAAVERQRFIVTELITLEVAKVRKELLEEMAVQVRAATLTLHSGIQGNALFAQMVGATFNCPLCGLRILGPSLTGQKNDLYEHPFGESMKLGGKQCELKGMKFKSPTMMIELVPSAKPATKPLTPNGE